MSHIRNWFKTHVFQIHSLAFLLIVTASIALYPAAENQDIAAILALIAVVVLGNLLALSVN